MNIVGHMACPNDDFFVRVAMDLTLCPYMRMLDVSIDNVTPGTVIELTFKSRDYITSNLIEITAGGLSDMYNEIMETSDDHKAFFMEGLNGILAV